MEGKSGLEFNMFLTHLTHLTRGNGDMVMWCVYF